MPVGVLPQLYSSRREGGFTALLIALLIVPLFGMLGIALDLGRCFMITDRLQTAADSAALSGAELLSAGFAQASVTPIVVSTFNSNILTGGLMGATVSTTTITYGGTSCIHVIATANVPSFIVQIVNISNTSLANTPLTVEALGQTPQKNNGTTNYFEIGNAILDSTATPITCP